MELFLYDWKKKKNGYVFAIFKLDQGGYIAWLENCY